MSFVREGFRSDFPVKGKFNRCRQGDIDKMIILYVKGEKVEAIASACNVDRSTLLRILRKYKVPKRKPGSGFWRKGRKGEVKSDV